MEVCVFCGISTSSVDQLVGPFQQLCGYNFHSKCLIFSTDVGKHADKNGELLEFDLRKTIGKVVDHGRGQICALCWQKGATIKCHENDCETTYHLDCALKSNQTLHLNFDNFQSYCCHHIPRCIFDFEPIVGILHKKSDCCEQINYTHDECIKKYLFNSKALSKCPFCLNVKNFRHQVETNMKLKIPKGKPSYAWKVNTQYYLKCSSVSCVCPKGRLFHKTNTDFDLILCENCGSDAIHKKCGNVGINWICNGCDVGTELRPESYINFNPGGQTRKRNKKSENMSSNKKMTGGKVDILMKNPEMPFGSTVKLSALLKPSNRNRVIIICLLLLLFFCFFFLMKSIFS